jgi:hypothetical protein
MALGPFALGWWRRLLDFRLQGYGLAILGAAATTIYLPYPALSLAVVAAVAYAFVQATLWGSDDRFGEDERNALRLAASCLTTMALCALVWRLVPGEYLGIAWLALALLMLEGGLRGWPDEFRHLSWIVGILAVARVAGFDLSSRLALISSGLAYAYALRARKEMNGRVLDIATWPATLFLLAGLAALLPAWAVSPAWALAALGLADSTASLARRDWLNAWSSRAVSPSIWAPSRSCDRAHHRLFGPQLPRTWQPSRLHSLLATTLLGARFTTVTGSVLTVARGAQAVVLLAGFPPRSRAPPLRLALF